jgi:integrase
MTYSELNGDEWLLPRQRSKNKKAHLVFLSQSVVDSIAAQPHAGEGRVVRCRVEAVREAMKRLCVEAGIEHKSPHDIRRTVGTVLAKGGFTSEIRSRILNHTLTGIGDTHYNSHDYAAEKRVAYTHLETEMRRIGMI